MASRTLVLALAMFGALVGGRSFAQLSGGLTPSLHSEVTPPVSVAPIAEDFGMRPFAFSSTELASGHSTKIKSGEEAHIWSALMALLSSRSGFHTKDEIEKALAETLIMSHRPKARGATGFWKAHTGNVDLTYFGDDETSKDGPSAYLTVAWNGLLKPSSCVPAQRALADVQIAGGRGLLQIRTTRRFRMGFGEEVQIESDALPEGCVSSFMLVSRPPRHSTAQQSLQSTQKRH